MRISNIKQYLGGADNVIARDIIEGDQFQFNFKIGSNPSTNLQNYTFDVDTQLFKANVTNAGSSVTINNLVSITSTTTDAEIINAFTNNSPVAGTGTPITNTYATGVAIDTTDNLSANLLIPTGLLSDLTSQNTIGNAFTSNASVDSTQPFLVVMSVTANDQASSITVGALDSKRTFRLLWILRYRPIVGTL